MYFRYFTSVLLIVCVSVFYPLAQAQEITEIIETLEIDTLLNNGSKDNRINLAWGNIAPDESTNPYPSRNDLVNDVNILLTYFDPGGSDPKNGFSQYRDFFNVYSIWFPDPIIFVAEPAYYQKTQGIRDALFLPWVSEQYGWVTMMYTGAGGNGAGVVRERRVGDATSSIDWETALHEFNHTMPGLYDEYTASGEWSNFQCIDGPNVTGQNVLSEVPWRKWLSQQTPIPTPYEELYFNQIGMFEGNISGYFGCYRPSAKSCYMGAGGFGEHFGQDLCSVCLQRFISMLYQYVNVIENPLPSEPVIEINGSETLSFSADFVKPEPNTQRYEWFLNGILIESGKEAISVNFDACDNYTLELVVTDTTTAVRYDEKFKNYYPEPKQTHQWVIEQNEVSGYDLDAQFIVKPSDCSASNTGSIAVEATSGLDPYVYAIDGILTENPIENLGPGNYMVTISDANGCSIYETIEVLQDPILDFQICSYYEEGLWILTASLLSVDEEELSYLWSTGSADHSIVVGAPGLYSLGITNSLGCTVTRELSLEEVSSPMNVSTKVGHSIQNKDNGSIYLEVDGGAKPYDITWFISELEDLTYPDENKVIASNTDPWTPSVYAFDNNFEYSEDFWAEAFTGENYVGFNFGKDTPIEVYSITSNVDTKERDAKAWKFQGSSDGTTWTDVDVVEFFEFPERLQKFDFKLESPVSYSYYRLIFNENWGSDRIVIQEIEFGIFANEEIIPNRNHLELLNLGPGVYGYEINDANNTCVRETISIDIIEEFSTSSIQLSVDGNYLVSIENPDSDLTYYWTANNDGTELLHTGTSFQPLQPGNYFVKPYDNSSNGFGTITRGFSVTMEAAPQVESTEAGLAIVEPDNKLEYYWYAQSMGGEPVHTGLLFDPEECGSYYVSARKINETISTAIDPETIPGITLWMDASDLDGDGFEDVGRENSSGYDWTFKTGGNWDENAWFPYRANYQNGHGVVDFSTMWYQGITGGTDQLRTIVLAYQESSFSHPNTAPFYGLKENIPRHTDATQLFSNTAPATTLNGRTYLNGDQVDPLLTENPMEFMVLSVVFTELVNNHIGASDELWEGKLGELIVWDVELSEEQLAGINEFMKSKWLSIAHLESPRSQISWGSGEPFDLGEDIISCEGSLVSLEAGSGFDSYEWNNGATTQAIEVMESGTYSVIATDINGCTTSDEIVISFNSPQTVDLGEDVLCANGMVVLDAGAGFDSYDWNNGATTQTIEVVETGTYSVVVTDSNGCSASDEVMVECPLAIEDVDTSISFFPNPTENFVIFKSSRHFEKLELKVLSLTGKVVLSKSYTSIVENTELRLDISGLKNGVYIAIINGQEIRKLIKQ